MPPLNGGPPLNGLEVDRPAPAAQPVTWDLRDGCLAAFVNDGPAPSPNLRARGDAGGRFERLHGCDPVDLHAAS